MEREESEDEGPCEAFGSLRLPLKLGTASGYVGVRFQEAAMASVKRL